MNKYQIWIVICFWFLTGIFAGWLFTWKYVNENYELYPTVFENKHYRIL